MSNNNIMVPIPTELKEIESEVVAGLTKRQLIGFGLTGAISIPSFFLLKRFGISVAMYGIFGISAPILFSTFYLKNKLYMEKRFKNFLESKVLFKEKRLYRVSNKNKEVAIARGFIKDDRKKKSISKN